MTSPIVRSRPPMAAGKGDDMTKRIPCDCSIRWNDGIPDLHRCPAHESGPDLLKSLETIKEMLSKTGQYSICHKDGTPIGFAESMVVGSVFGDADKAIAKARGDA